MDFLFFLTELTNQIWLNSRLSNPCKMWESLAEGPQLKSRNTRAGNVMFQRFLNAINKISLYYLMVCSQKLSRTFARLQAAKLPHRTPDIPHGTCRPFSFIPYSKAGPAAMLQLKVKQSGACQPTRNLGDP